MFRLPGESKDTIIDDIRVRYTQAGQGAPVILVHGLGSSSISWRDNFATLSERYRVYAMDLPGHGDSDKPPIPYDSAYMVEFMRKFIAMIGHERVTLVGTSLGGGLCLLTALEHPQMISHLILSASGGLGRKVAFMLRVYTLPIVGELFSKGPLDSVSPMLKSVFYDKSHITDELLSELRRTNKLPGASETALRITRKHLGLFGIRRQSIFFQRLGELEIPTQIFWGANDAVFPVAHARRAAEVISNCELHVFDDCGHMPHMERADDFNRLTLDFLSSTPTPEVKQTVSTIAR